MKKLMLALLPLLLGACAAGAGRDFASNPSQYGLYVAQVNVYMDTPVAVKNADTGEIVAIKVRHYGGAQDGYLVESLPPGRYLLESYTPDGVTAYPLETANGYFNVQADCFNYGGRYDFGVDADGKPSYTNSTTLKDIESLPGNIRSYARGRDICASGMGKDSDRLAAADVQGNLSL
ncbi:MAG: hypothetical protein ACHQAZ_02480 [Gammaproteobacteria bacterium]